MSEAKGNFDFSSNNYNSNYNDQFGASPPPYPGLGANPNLGFNPEANQNPGFDPRANQNPGGFQPPIQSPPTSVVMSYDHMKNQNQIPKVKFGPRPVLMLCPNCNSNISTRTDTKPGQKSWVFCLGLCAVGCGLCAWIPFLVDDFKETTHTCPNCNAFLGKYNDKF